MLQKQERRNKKNSTKYVLILLVFLAISEASLKSTPALQTTKVVSTEQKTISMTEHQISKISTLGEGLSTLKLKATENAAPISFCQIYDRHVNFQSLKTYDIYTPVLDEYGFATEDMPYTASWNLLNPVQELHYANLMNLDSNSVLSFYIMNPNQNYTSKVYSMSLSKYITPDQYLINPVLIAQGGRSVFISFQNPQQFSPIRIVRVFSQSGSLISEELSTSLFKGSEQPLVDMTSFQIPNKEDSLLFLLTNMKVFILKVDPTGLVSAPLITSPIISGNQVRMLVSIKLYNSVDAQNSSILNIYILCQLSGLFKYTYDFSGSATTKAIQDMSFQISATNGVIFNQYRGRIFFITTSVDIYQVREYEVLNNNSGDYYLNRVHEVNHKVKDIVVYDYYIIILGSNSHTISWHSVHPSLFQDIVLKQQYFSALSLQGGIVTPMMNTTSNQLEPYFVGFQRRHIFMNRVVSVGAYLYCDPQLVEQSVVGQHPLKVGFVSYNFLAYNSYQVQEYELDWTIKVNKVYADYLTAGAIAGIVIACVFLLVVIILVIYCRIKRQRLYKNQLTNEVELHLQRKNSFTPFKETDNRPYDKSPINQGEQIQATNNFGLGAIPVESNKIAQQNVHHERKQSEQDIIQFNEDDDDE